jgi:hypothetical protein
MRDRSSLQFAPHQLELFARQLAFRVPAAGDVDGTLLGAQSVRLNQPLDQRHDRQHYEDRYQGVEEADAHDAPRHCISAAPGHPRLAPHASIHANRGKVVLNGLPATPGQRAANATGAILNSDFTVALLSGRRSDTEQALSSAAQVPGALPRAHDRLRRKSIRRGAAA